jgi:hypothetical protein
MPALSASRRFGASCKEILHHPTGQFCYIESTGLLELIASERILPVIGVDCVSAHSRIAVQVASARHFATKP